MQITGSLLYAGTRFATWKSFGENVSTTFLHC